VEQVGKPGLARSRCVTANLPFISIRKFESCATLMLLSIFAAQSKSRHALTRDG
jgi:hypothetical protein